MSRGEKKPNAKALLPMAVFFVLYLGMGITFEYVLKIPMGFYKVPLVVVFLVALLIAALQNRKVSMDEKIEIMAKGIGNKDLLSMLFIFLEAGIFVGIVGRSSAESVAYFILSLFPAQFAVVLLFLIGSIVSISMGTSVGTITLLIPIGVSVATGSAVPVPLCMGAVISGAMFGDNLSFISDTTIAACNGQGCGMKDKFKENFLIAIPAAFFAGVVFYMQSLGSAQGTVITGEKNLLLALPYGVVFLGGLLGGNVFLVLLLGIVSGAILVVVTNYVEICDLVFNMGSGASGMFETCIIAILVTGIGALMEANGGFAAILCAVKKLFKGKRAGALGMGLVVAFIDLVTANNTVAIVMANPIAKEIGEEYGITSKQAASILDTFSCVMQGVLPYGAQMLVAIAAVAELGINVSPLQVLPYLYYPFFLLCSCCVKIFFGKMK